MSHKRKNAREAVTVDFSIMPVRNKVSSLKKKRKMGKTDVYFYFYYLLISKAKSSVMTYEIKTYLRHDEFIWLAYHFKYYSPYILYIVMFVCLSIRGNWLHFFFNIEHKMKLPIKFQIPSKSEGSQFGSNLELIVHVC